tara:strand:+ start:41 stop:373 length:333 start_codon:yes stop_codon:yes gene_type:complete
MQKMSLKKLNDLFSGNARALLFVKSDHCHLCHKFEPIVYSLERKYHGDIRFFVSSDEEEVVAEAVAEQINGVPSVILFKPDGYLVVPDPVEPDPHTWYTREYIDNFLKEW